MEEGLQALSCLFGGILYPLVGFQPKLGKLARFLAINIVHSMTSSAVGLMIGALVGTGMLALLDHLFLVWLRIAHSFLVFLCNWLAAGLPPPPSILTRTQSPSSEVALAMLPPIVVLQIGARSRHRSRSGLHAASASCPQLLPRGLGSLALPLLITVPKRPLAPASPGFISIPSLIPSS